MGKEMKNSGVEWIGQIPESWRVAAIKREFYITSGTTPKSDNLEYWDGDIVWITPADYKTSDKYVSAGRRNISETGYKSCGTTMIPAGSIVFSKRAPVGTVCINTIPLCTNQGCLSCTRKLDANCTYYYYMMSVITEQFELVSSGTTFKEISADSFANFVLPLPPTDIQATIANYLDEKCAEIDAVLDKTRASIEEYKKMKQAVITQAVTKGVRGDRPMKNSGIEWAREIPEEWPVLRGKNLFRETNERSETGTEELLTVSHITGITPRSQKNVNMFMSESLVGYKICHVDDIAANTMWMWQGAIGVSKYEGVISPSYNTYRQTNGAYDSEYLDYLLRIRPLVDTYSAYSTGITASRLRLYPYQFLSLMYVVPPIKEQKEIADYLDEKISEVDTLIEKKERFLSELESYKKSLIYDYVTGKKEV